MSLSDECKKYVSKIKKLAKEPKAKKLSGYNLFSKEKRKELEGTSVEKMKELGAMWKKCSDEKKEIWNTKAKKLNKKAAKEFEEEGEELDEQVKELKDLIEEIIANFKKSAKKVKGKKGKKIVESDDDSENEIPVKDKKVRYNSSSTLVEDFEEVPVKKSHSKKMKVNKVVVEDSDSDSEAEAPKKSTKNVSDDEYSDDEISHAKKVESESEDDVTLIIKKNKKINHHH